MPNPDNQYRYERIHVKDCQRLAYQYLMECKGKTRAELSTDYDLHSNAATRYNKLAENEMRRPGRSSLREHYRLTYVAERHEIIAEIANYITRSKLDPKEYGNWVKNFRHSEAFWFATQYADKIGDRGFLDFNFMEGMTK